jgi:hypothetical protein
VACDLQLTRVNRRHPKVTAKVPSSGEGRIEVVPRHLLVDLPAKSDGDAAKTVRKCWERVLELCAGRSAPK